jgi:hypothetical protein
MLIERGAYEEMDACLMLVITDSNLNLSSLIGSLQHRSHPSPGPTLTVCLGPTIAMQKVEVEYFGHASVNLNLWTHSMLIWRQQPAPMLAGSPGKERMPWMQPSSHILP